jgi:hypothetical protein
LSIEPAIAQQQLIERRTESFHGPIAFYPAGAASVEPGPDTRNRILSNAR